MCTKDFPVGLTIGTNYAETHLQSGTAKGMHILSKNHFLCEVATFVTASTTEEETSCSMSRMKEICSCFSFIPPAELFLLFLPISCRICSKSPYRMPALTSPGPSRISSSPLPSPECLQSTFHLPWC